MIICLTSDEAIVGAQLLIGCSELYTKMFRFSSISDNHSGFSYNQNEKLYVFYSVKTWCVYFCFCFCFFYSQSNG